MSTLNIGNCPQFKPGDIVYDTINRDIGVLIRKYILFEHYVDPWHDDYESDDGFQDVMVWDIYWTGYNSWGWDEPLQTYTEEGLKILFESGVLNHFKNT